MKAIIALALTLGVSIMVSSCDAEADTLKGNVEVLHQGTYINSGVYTSKTLRVFEDQASYEAALLGYTDADAQLIDFTTHKVVLVDIGQKNTGGYGVNVADTESEDGYLTVTAVTSVPGKGCGVTDALTNPYVFVSINTTQDILFSETLKVEECE
ncbi:protease complex subunit PrcB family protein [Gynuella sp.]|uniref:protease complex subunit PrcB family protein n=1 Tax=Gynuella sp. TaxID=2969146 RepID=UPI003D09C918